MKSIWIATSAVMLCTASLHAQSAKSAASINGVSVDPCQASSTSGTSCNTGWVDIQTTQIKTSNVTDLFVNTSLVTGLYTETAVKGNSTGETSEAKAEASVEVRVVLDPVTDPITGAVTGKYGYPSTQGDGVVFNARVQTLTANLGYIYTQCLAQGGTGCALTEEQIKLVLDTTSAHAFNFIFLNVGAGNHSMKIQARRAAKSTAYTGGIAVSKAIYGLGSTTVEAVRLVNKFEF